MRIDGERFDGVREIAGQRPHQEVAGVLRVVVDARHHVRTTESLRILERRVGNLLARLEVEEAQHDGRGAEIHREAVNRPGASSDLSSFNEDAIAVARHCWLELERTRTHRKPERMPLDLHLTAAHRVTRDDTVRADDACLTGKPEASFEMGLRWRARREQRHAIGHFDDALLALAVLDAGSGHLNAERLGVVEY